MVALRRTWSLTAVNDGSHSWIVRRFHPKRTERHDTKASTPSSAELCRDFRLSMTMVNERPPLADNM